MTNADRLDGEMIDEHFSLPFLRVVRYEPEKRFRENDDGLYRRGVHAV